jgi:hypothetical protein
VVLCIRPFDRYTTTDIDARFEGNRDVRKGRAPEVDILNTAIGSAINGHVRSEAI